MVMGSLRQQTQLVVIGAGPGGYVAALRAADLGAEVLLVDDREQPGGVCLLEGCIPSKTLIHAVEVAQAARDGYRFGLTFKDLTVDPAVLRQFVATVVGSLAQGVRGLLRRRGVEYVRGRAHFAGPHSIELEDSELSGIDFRQAIIATGSRVAPFAPARDLPVWSSTEALQLPALPERLVLVGGGYIGLELGLVYAGLGSRVTLVEFAPRLLTAADPDLTAVVLDVCRKRFADILVDSRVVDIQHGAAGYAVRVEHDRQLHTLQADQVLVAVGRRPNSDGLGLQAAGLAPDAHGFIPVDEQNRTAVEHIFAIGDVVAGPMLAHKAAREAKVAAEVLAQHPSAFDNRAIPAVVYTDPEIAWAGLTEREAEQQNRAVKIGRFPLSALGRARTLGRSEGFVKILADPQSDLVLGVGMVAPNASELIAEATLAIELGATLEDLMVTIHPHPTLSEAIMEAAEAAAGQPIHQHPALPKP